MCEKHSLPMRWIVQIGRRRIQEEIMLDGRDPEPFCTVLPGKVNEAITVSRESEARQTLRPYLLPWGMLTQT